MVEWMIGRGSRLCLFSVLCSCDVFVKFILISTESVVFCTRVILWIMTQNC